MRIVTCAINEIPFAVSIRLAERRPQPGDQRVEPGCQLLGHAGALPRPRFHAPGGMRDPLERRLQALRRVVRFIAVRRHESGTPSSSEEACTQDATTLEGQA